MIFSFLPIWIVDVGGALVMIVFSFLSVYYAVQLRKRDPQNIVWTYLLWISLALAVFAVSRSVGHIVKQMLILFEQPGLWEQLRPYSGAINSLTFVMVGALTLFFERTWTVYQDIVRDRRALQHAHRDVLFLNQNLERLVAERTEALTRSEHKYRRIFEASKDIILTSDHRGRILDINPAGRQLLGLPAQAPAEPECIQGFLRDPQLWPSILEAIEQQGFAASMEVDMKSVQGGRLRVLLSANRSADSDQTIHFLIKDIEQQFLMREQMAQADKLASIGELSAGIAHEINNPLGIILGYTQLMLRSEKDDPQRREDLKTVEKHVRHCKSIVEDLLNFARTSHPKKELLDIHTVMDEVLNFIQQHSKLGRIEIRKKYDPRVGRVLVDEKKIKQVFINLIMNAIHAVGGRGVITIQTGLSDPTDRVLIRVQDTGSGIEEKNLARIFDPFFTTKPTGQGTGLGLSVSYGIIRNHGGDITVESRLGEGSTFTVALPLAPSVEGR